MSFISEIKTSSDKQVTSSRDAYSGYLIICGHCSNSILFPEDAEYVKCPVCKQVNFLNKQGVNAATEKAAIQCPHCHRLILYTIGCTHFICLCGSTLSIQEPEYYVPHYPSSNRS